MGCSLGRAIENSVEEKLLKASQNDLGFYKFSTKNLIQKFTKNSKTGLLNIVGIENTLKSLELYNQTMVNFLTNFSHNGNFSLKKICCLCVFLGYSSLPQKIQLLFRTYADSTLDLFYRSDIELMLSHIIFLHLVAIPTHSLNMQITTDKSFIMYCEKLGLFVNSMLKHYLKLLLLGSNEISLIEFSLRILQKDTRDLMSGKKLRSFISKNFGNFKIKSACTDLSSRKYEKTRLMKGKKISIHRHSISIA